MKPIKTEVYPKQIAFNCLPHIDVFLENGYTKEEMKMVNETKKIMEDDSILVNPTAVRVPVFFGHSEAVHIETKQKITAQQAKDLLAKTEGIVLVDDPANLEYPTAVTHAVDTNPVYVGRVREDVSHPLGLNMWVVADNVRKGAATNAVQIAQILIRDYL
jgi:aspartate-semialdehyde dehydrogenase